MLIVHSFSREICDGTPDPQRHPPSPQLSTNVECVWTYNTTRADYNSIYAGMKNIIMEVCVFVDVFFCFFVVVVVKAFPSRRAFRCLAGRCVVFFLMLNRAHSHGKRGADLCQRVLAQRPRDALFDGAKGNGDLRHHRQPRLVRQPPLRAPFCPWPDTGCPCSPGRLHCWFNLLPPPR